MLLRANHGLKHNHLQRPRKFSLATLFTRLSSSDIMKRDIEIELHTSGYPFVIGVDEAGRGPLAGPVVAAALVCLPSHKNLLPAADSKVLSPKKRMEIYDSIKDDPTILFASTMISNLEIDRINILQATLLAMQTSVELVLNNNQSPLYQNLEKCYCVVDGNKSPKLDIKTRPIVKGDSLVYCIALASIIAKVERDMIMLQLDNTYPEYGFAKHKGYPTKDHILALHKYGPCAVHRFSFKPVKGRIPISSPDIAT